jgi:MFS transporter, Spinster family, sphingosine-1-phosphate transporter
MAQLTHYATFDPADRRSAPRRYMWAVFAILFALMVVDYIDRQVVVSMFPHLKAQWNLSDRQLGSLVSIVSVTVALGAVPLSLLADRWSRVKSIFLMAIVWSLATIACAFAGSYLQLLGIRGVVGLGEAAYGTIGGALLASFFPARMRSTVLGAFIAASTLGSVLGVVLGGFVAQRWGWQAGFGAVGGPGLLLAMLFPLIVRDYKTVSLPAKDCAGNSPRLSARAVVIELLRPRTALMTCIGAGLSLLVFSTTYAWLPSYLNRYYGVAPDRAGLMTGVVVLLGGLGALLSSVLSDRLTRRFPRARLYVPAVSSVLTTVTMVAAFAGVGPGPLQFALLAVGGLLMAGSIGPTDAVVIDVIHPGLRATGGSILSLMRNLFGLAAGPLLAGALSDAYGLQFAMAVVPLFGLGAAAAFVAAARTYEEDRNAIAPVEQPSLTGFVPRPAWAPRTA